MIVIKAAKSGLKPAQLKTAVDVLKSGGTIVYPTDTAYGLGADATNPAAIDRIYKIKERLPHKALSVMVSSAKDLSAAVIETKDSTELVKDFWPGALTIVLTKKGDLPEVLTGGKKTLAVRLPKNKICLQLAKAFKKPITTTSANISGTENLYSAAKIISQFAKTDAQPDLLIDVGTLPVTAPSTIIDLTSKPYKILRAGPISKMEIELALHQEIP